MMRFLAVLLLLALGGCATPDAATAAAEDRTAAWDEAVDNFYAREARCKAWRKAMVLRRTGTRIRRGPTTAELKSAQCL